jgi:macrolide transport system ATP-binding/permease protein
LDADSLALLRREHIGFIFQRYNLLPRLDAVGNAELPAIYAGRAKADRRALAIELLTRMGLGERLLHRPNELSGGQQQRVCIARAMINGAEVLLADEPTGALDSHSGRALLEVLRSCVSAGRTVVVVTHDPNVASAADRMIELSDGQIVRDSPTTGTAIQTSAPPRAAMHPSRLISGTVPVLGETLACAMQSIGANRLRAALTTLGIAIGIAALTSIVAVTEGASAALQATVGELSSNTIAVRRGVREHDPAENEVRTMGEAELRALASLPDVVGVSPVIESSARVRYGGHDVKVYLSGIDAFGLVLEPALLAAGREVSVEDIARARDVVVLNDTARRKLFPPGEEALGRTVLLGNRPATVIGVTQRQNLLGEFITFGGPRGWMPYSTMLTRLAGRSYLDGYTVMLRRDAEPKVAEARVVALLQRMHGRKDFYTYNAASEWESFMRVTRITSLVLGLIGAISLLVGGVGVMNIMLVAVAERTQEIGIRMAVGARASDVARQFLIEAVLLCLLGGMAGLALSVLICAAISTAVHDFPVHISALAVGVAFGTCLLIGIGFGWFPAKRAARLDPVVALARE